MPNVSVSPLGRSLAMAGALLLSAFAATLSAEDESQPCNPDGQQLVYGNVLAGCTIEVIADLDIFTFTASAAEDVTIVLTRTGGTTFSQACLLLLDPDGVQLANPCGNTRINTGPLAKSGIFQMIVTAQNNNGTVIFNLSLERLFPLRNPTPVGAGDVLSAREINPIADLDTFSFNATPGDSLRLILTRTGGTTFSQLCTEVRGPDNSSFVSLTCGNLDLVLPAFPAAGPYQIIVTAQNNNGTVTFNMGLSCLSGTCASRPPVCLVNPSYTGGTLTLDFTIGSPQAAEWHLAILAFGSVFTLWKVPLPIVDPAVDFTVPIPGFPPIGNIGLLSTLTTPSGLVCADLKTVDTGGSADVLRRR